ncbi:MAG: ribosome hibernation-promoting factor, HPF/YfiA family [Bacteroidales bacterium]
MKVKVNAIHFDIAKHLEEFIEKKVAKLTQCNDAIISTDVVLKVVKAESFLNKEVSIRVKIPQNELFSEKVCDTFEEAVDLNVEALLKQLNRVKEKSAR